jgi:hypothetical protein
MIGVLVRDEHGIQIFRFLADFRQPARQLTYTQACVDQNPGLRGGEKRRIPCTAARKYAESDQRTILLRPVLAGTRAWHKRGQA